MTTEDTAPGPEGDTPWLTADAHRDFLAEDAARQLDFFRASQRPDAGFYTLGYDGAPLESDLQELHTTTRLVHAYALGKLAGAADCEAIIDQGMRYLWSHHRDADHGGYLWGIKGDRAVDDRKLAYGHVFVLLAGSSAKMAGHPEADRLIADVAEVLETRFWEPDHGRFADEWSRDWTPFSTYRGMNANMHGVEALLGAYEATGEGVFLEKAGKILAFFLLEMAPEYDWRLPEHYTETWQVDRAYSGDPMFRPAGTTPGHSFEMARLALQYWDLAGRPESGLPNAARQLVATGFADAWRDEGGISYTLNFDGSPSIRDRYWWPVTEAIGAVAALLKWDPQPADEDWYRRLWRFASAHFIDHARGGWFPEIGPDGAPQVTQFAGKPDIYHALQADLLPLTPGLSGAYQGLGGVLARAAD
ncbi:AGE family epimerase/isomerase [Paracoccaceae bacterium GXU_MW_L88]